MTVLLELNDCAIRGRRDGDTVVTSPGFALLQNEELQVGEQARRQARLYPLATYSNFWHRLDQQPLTRPSNRYRHQADLLFAHLEHIRGEAGQAEELLFAVPGDLTSEQLGLLLGVVEAGGARVTGLVDAAAGLSVSAAAGDYCLVDMHLHRAVISDVSVGDEARTSASRRVEKTGLERATVLAAAAIADAFISDQRFDPHSDPATEQAVHDHLPEWFALLRSNPEISIGIEYKGTLHQARLKRSALTRVLEPIYEDILQSLDAGATTVLTERVARLPDAIERLRARAVLPDGAVLGGCELHAERIAGGGSVSLLRALPASGTGSLIAADTETRPAARSTPARAAGDAAPHLLSGHNATPIGSPELFLHSSGAAAPRRGPDACCTVARDADGLLLRVLDGHTVHLNSAPAAALERLQPGDHLLLMEGAASFRVINVVPGDA